jgi:lysyl-tRNA synthetase class 1
LSNKVKHWSEVISNEIISTKKEPFTIAAGITTSGPCHIGTACEFLYPSALVKYLKNEGREVNFVFVGDLMDALDSVPQSLREFKFLNDWLGRPLFKVPDPYGCCGSYGDHFLNEVADLMEQFEIEAKILKTNELVHTGRYDPYVKLLFEKRSIVKDVAQRIAALSGSSSFPDWVNIVMPICDRCGRISTTRIIGFDGDTVEYEDVGNTKYTQGCGYKGEMRISDHNYKLYWRLDWPSRQDFLNVSAEMAGIDHHTRGGSWDTAVAIHREVFDKEPPVGQRYGFVLLRGKKYSKSRGIGLSVQEILKLVPPEIIKYRLFRPDIEENKNFNPSGYSLIKLYIDYNEAADLYEKKGELRRAENKKVLAYTLSTEKRKWRVNFTDLLIHYQIYNDWNKIMERLDDREGIRYLSKYIESWIEEEYQPEEYVFSLKPEKTDRLNSELADFAAKLQPDMTAEEVHELVYDVAKKWNVKTPELFKVLYTSLIGKEYGPRLGGTITAIGVGKVKKILEKSYLSK